MAKPQIKARLLAFFVQTQGSVITLDRLHKEFSDLTADQLRTGVNNLRNSAPHESGGLDMKASLRVVARGNAWLYTPVQANATPPGGPTCFESMGTTQGGDLIIRADDGTIWKATAL